MNKKEKKTLEQYFGIYESDDFYELEQWTNGGVNMIIVLHKEDKRFNSITEQFRYYVEGFDIDEEIELYREGEDYRNNFTITESVKDFEDWKKYIKNVLNKLEEEEKRKMKDNEVYYCNRCDSKVSKSTLKGYAYQCLECAEDLFTFEVYKNKTKVNWKKVAIYNFVEWLKDTESVSELMVFNDGFVNDRDIEDFILSIDINYFEDNEVENHAIEDIEIFLKSVFIDKEYV